MTGLVNWRRELMIIALAGMEACWLTGLARVLIKAPGSAEPLVSWWSVLLVFLVALTVLRVAGRLDLSYGHWLIAGLALLTSVFLVQFNLGRSLFFLRNPSNAGSGHAILVLVSGLLVWYRALRITGYAGDTRDTIRQFKFGLVVLVGVTLATLRTPARMTDLVFCYFACGLLAVALTRIEEVAETEHSAAAPLDLKWLITLAATLLTVGAVVLLAGRVITIETLRWALRPFVLLLQVGLVACVYVVTFLMMQFLPLLSGLFDGFPAEELQDTAQDWRDTAGQPLDGEPTKGIELSAQLLEALQWAVIVILVALALWLIARSFRRWRLEQSTTPGGVRESVSSEGAIADEVARYLRDQWQRLRDADLRRLFRRVGAESVRAIYASLLHLMADAGCQRLPEQTPNEFCPVAEDVLPARRVELQTITEAYERAHYGEVDISADELARIQLAWQSVKADAEELSKAEFRGRSL